MTVALVWFRYDLRLNDNPAFIEACSHHQFVIPLYIYDGKNSVSGEAQDWWLHHSLTSLSESLAQLGLNLILRKGDPFEIISDLVKKLSVSSVYWNRCYEPAAISRDKKIKAALLERGIEVQSSNGSLLHEPWTIKNKNGDYFKVFTPYWKHCKQHLNIQPSMYLENRPAGIEVQSEVLKDWKLLPAINWAAQFSEYWTPGEAGAQQKLHEFIEHHLNDYKKNRDFPIKNATSRLSPHLHFGEISPWTILRAIELAKLNPNCDLSSADHFLSELGWREFSVYLLYHFPKLPYENFRSEFDAFPWHNDKELLARWQNGLTGYPIIDAGMRELWATGYMHNRVRMIVASFLTKGLLIDWRLGADWFLDTLVDADLANNSASWQWVAGCGADAAPYFRIFNPVLQSQKFDPDGHYIRHWVSELSHLQSQYIHAPWESADSERIYLTTHYPKPIINHHEARTRALKYYNQLKKK
ncbi:DNA photolyase family protein [Fluoribacter dumoffii]|uniref:Deoxyribodipyrimidine photo-lyase n=1 Tax=Fluoribacter dumoffii TaxID=463 RepID=A0A377GCB4_9GAMM|nr:deoxyribodipyrimidine photo-lyase [Fluoribacter dumoffii]KTC90472.1 deoxyribodipyrimidine photolyase phrB [Fluoribacter dumoffii NY 23]MCW8386150.1 DNA photolyase family protein [Fluoribacter dumoffii]MCW8419201.1 DNA photolyase family protein [Fluoribacter dumoffii]MCW8452924.1 DNA photolyase family protein [Fluoribacter dumoffii]MCW8459826.1 DNA photolyase family protein [Fluoribacter dumoffii]